MFTGLVSHVQKVISIEEEDKKKTFSIDFPNTSDIEIGDSICINGACQTVVKKTDCSFKFIAFYETLKKTNLGSLKNGDFVNIELSLLPSTRLGGHFVTGHVNCTCKIEYLKEEETNNIYLGVFIENDFMPYLVKEGSVCIDGISLTVADLVENTLRLNIISHTLDNTNLKYKKAGGFVNVEFDILAKYIINFLSKFK